MRRQDKYPNTEWFVWYNANPKNRISTFDCVVRAISVLTNISWEQTLRNITELGIPLGRVYNDEYVYNKYLENLGYVKMAQPKFANGTKLTGKQFCDLFKLPCAAHIGGHHMVYIDNGKVYDTWDSTEGTIGNFWVAQSNFNYANHFILELKGSR